MSLKGMVVTVGGSPEPIVFSINGDKPEMILFVVSSGSRSQVYEQILPKLEYTPQHESLEISNHENLGTCYKEIRQGVTDWMWRRQLGQDDARVDYTGGTKPMSAALALASVEMFGDFKYIASYRRSKGGLGAGESGFEHHARNVNPWNTLAVRELERANWLLRRFHADAAAEVLTDAAAKCDDAYKNRLESFATLAQSLSLADRFQFPDAEKRFNRCRRDLLYTLNDFSTYQILLSHLESWKAIGVQVRSNGKTPGRETLLELLANAERRAAQARYDDATGRLYRAVELYAQQLVKQAFDTELGKPQLTDFPANRCDEVVREFGEPESDGRYKLGVQKLFAALQFSDDAELRERAGLYSLFEDHLQNRNQSLLAHGVRPVSAEDFHKLWEAMLTALEIDATHIPRWPHLELRL